MNKLKENIKKYASVIWHVPGVENAALKLVAKLLIRAGLGAGGASVVVAIVEALASSI